MKKCIIISIIILMVTHTVVLASSWQQVSGGLHCSFVSKDEHYEKNQVPSGSESHTWQTTAWRGERISTEILLWSSSQIQDVTITLGNLVKGNALIPASALRYNFLDYVITDDGGANCGNNMSRPTSLVADVLDTRQTSTISANTVQPVWLSVDVPSTAEAGIYTGTIDISSGGVTTVMTVILEVLDIALGSSSEWDYHLDLWQNPWSVARYHNVTPWSQEHWSLLDPLITMLADSGQKVITTTILNRPWNGQTYDAYQSMVTWIKKTNGTWTYDYTVFDQYVQFCMDRGISKQISCFSMVPWGNRHYYLDEATGNMTYLTLNPNTTAYNQHWQPFLNDFVQHLTAKGWLNKTCIAMDERSDSDMQGVISLVNQASSELGLSMATNHYTTVMDSVDDICFGYTHIPSNIKDLAATRRLQGKTTTYYVCCADAHPNNFVYSKPAENVWLGWYGAKNNLDGSLRWAYNSWVANPLIDARHTRFQGGDCFFVYPGARSSLRFERLREGIQDYEKIKVLESVLADGWKIELQNVLDSFVPNSNYTLAVNEAKASMVEITKHHINGDTPPMPQVNLALNQPTESSSCECSYGRDSSKAVDGNTGTRWCAINGQVNHWLLVDLGESKALSSYGILWEFNNKKYDYIIETSADKINWTTRVNRSNNSQTSQHQEGSIVGEGRYIRLKIVGLQSGCWASLYEFEIF